jgi:hypothetical protein
MGIVNRGSVQILDPVQVTSQIGNVATVFAVRF